ncbi:hypothetical protein LX32DRAFT_258113 [Colletotrichum zoysiae]|uniref:Uncharacterized protein n=1 Tax=Colletotrichum zoysiae TaxID=1216348 RepID=A0AAD9HPH3_9PEZI|nr:hypothetical protein LX32DRAFT_258113 [Colletotrichum zoysiae]
MNHATMGKGRMVPVKIPLMCHHPRGKECAGHGTSPAHLNPQRLGLVTGLSIHDYRRVFRVAGVSSGSRPRPRASVPTSRDRAPDADAVRHGAKRGRASGENATSYPQKETPSLRAAKSPLVPLRKPSPGHQQSILSQADRWIRNCNESSGTLTREADRRTIGNKRNNSLLFYPVKIKKKSNRWEMEAGSESQVSWALYSKRRP